MVLGRFRLFPVVPAAGGRGARPAGLRVRLLRLPQPHQGRLFLDHHAGPGVCRDAAVLPQRDRLRWQQRLHRLQAHPRLRHHLARDAGDLVRAVGDAADERADPRPLSGDLEVRAGAGGDPRRREPGDVHRLPAAQLQALRLDPVGGAVRARRCTLRAAGRHHQPVRDDAGELDRDRDLGRGRRARHADRAGGRRRDRQSGEELLHRHFPGVLAVLPRLPVHRRHPVPAAGRGRAVPPAARQGRREVLRRAGRRRCRGRRRVGPG